MKRRSALLTSVLGLALLVGSGCVDLAKPGSVTSIDGAPADVLTDGKVPALDTREAGPSDSGDPVDPPDGGGVDTIADPPPDASDDGPVLPVEAAPEAGAPDLTGGPDAADKPDVAPVVDVAAEVPVTNQAPTVAMAAMAAPAPVTGTSSVLSVRGADDQGEASLVYTWSTTGSPPGPVGFSINGSNAAKSVTATFTVAGSYGLEVEIRDGAGLTVKSSIALTVMQVANDISISPSLVTLAAGGTYAFTAKVFDQFGAAMSSQVSPTWSLSGGSCGTVSNAGFFTAGVGPASTCTLSATVGAVSAEASISVGSAVSVQLPNADSYVDESDSDRNFGKDTSVLVKSQDGASNTREAYLRFSLSPMTAPKQALLRLYGRSTGSTSQDSVMDVDNVSWSESSLTWKNRPGFGSSHGSVSVTTTAKYREWDVTALVSQALARSDSSITFGIHMQSATNNSPDSFNSREAASNQPQLVITQ
jgi:hypothetical protein